MISFITGNINVLATAASLAMDAFSVAICLGICHEYLTKKEALSLGLAFGFFQFLNFQRKATTKLYFNFY